MNKIEEVIKDGKLENCIYYLPDIQLDRKEYTDIAKHLEFLGGKWKGGKIKGFIFDRDINSIEELFGNNIVTKKEIQLFETPKDIVELLCDYADIDNYQTFLEPSAGRGAIIKEIQNRCSCQIDYCEINDVNCLYLDKISNINFLANDFLKLETDNRYSRIVANPPFAKNQDIEHIMKMYSLLKDDGILVSISSKHWENCDNKKEKEFRKFLDEVNAEIINIDSGKFKDSGTLIATNIIVIRKSRTLN